MIGCKSSPQTVCNIDAEVGNNDAKWTGTLDRIGIGCKYSSTQIGCKSSSTQIGCKSSSQTVCDIGAEVGNIDVEQTGIPEQI